MLRYAPSFDRLIQLNFRVATAREMTILGHESAALFSLEHLQIEFNSVVGITGVPNSGKTHFCAGLISAFKPVSIETLNREPFNLITEAGGHICHFDYKDDPDYFPRLDLSMDHSTILVEHGELSEFDFTHWLEVTQDKDSSRIVTLEIPSDMAEEPALETFRQRTQKFTLA